MRGSARVCRIVRALFSTQRCPPYLERLDMHLPITVTRRDGYTVLAPQGEIDFATGPQLKDAITELLVTGEVHLVIDLLAVDFIESTGLGALIGGRRRAHALKGSLSLVCTEDQMLKIFRITGLDKVFSIHGSVEEATGQRAVAS